jgi:DNA-binding response OmpR family regulator
MPFILLVEDDYQLREMLHTILTSSGYVVWEAPNGKTANRLCQQRKPDLVITDLIMPNKDGFELISDLRRKDPTVKIVVISGGGEKIPAECHLRMARKLGVQHTLSKPFGPAEFLETVRLALEAGNQSANPNLKAA